MTLKELREKAGLSQSEAAKTFGTNTRTWGSWERGERTPNPKRIKEIKEKLKKMDLSLMKTGLIMIDRLYDEDILFTAEQAFLIAKAAIEYQLAWYKSSNNNTYYNYEPEVLKETLKKLKKESFFDIEINANIEELVKKHVSFITFDDIVKVIERNTVFIY